MWMLLHTEKLLSTEKLQNWLIIIFLIKFFSIEIFKAIYEKRFLSQVRYSRVVKFINEKSKKVKNVHVIT